MEIRTGHFQGVVWFHGEVDFQDMVKSLSDGEILALAYTQCTLIEDCPPRLCAR